MLRRLFLKPKRGIKSEKTQRTLLKEAITNLSQEQRKAFKALLITGYPKGLTEVCSYNYGLLSEREIKELTMAARRLEEEEELTHKLAQGAA